MKCRIDGSTNHFMLLENNFACTMLLLRLVMKILPPENDFPSRKINSPRKRISAAAPSALASSGPALLQGPCCVWLTCQPPEASLGNANPHHHAECWRSAIRRPRRNAMARPNATPEHPSSSAGASSKQHWPGGAGATEIVFVALEIGFRVL